MHGGRLRNDDPLMVAAPVSVEESFSVGSELQVEPEPRRERVPGVERAQPLDGLSRLLSRDVVPDEVRAGEPAAVEPEAEVERQPFDVRQRVLSVGADASGIAAVKRRAPGSRPGRARRGNRGTELLPAIRTRRAGWHRRTGPRT